MIAVVVSLVAVVLLVLVVVALGMRSMSRRESSLPPERLKEMAEKEERTQTRSTDEFASHEPRMANFSPDFSPIGEREPKPVRTGQRGRRGVDEWGNPSTDDDDEEFWANIRSDAEEGGFGAGGTVAARKASSRPVEREKPAERPATPKRQERTAKPRPAAASAAVDPDATTVQAPLPQRQPASAAANLADLVEPAKRPVPSQSELADQRTVTFAAPTADVMSILGAGAQPVPSPRPDSLSSNNSPRSGTGAFPATPAANGTFPANPVSRPGGSGSYPATPASSGSFPAQPAPIHGAPTSDPFPAYNNAAETTWTNPPATPSSSGSWPAQPDILDDPSPAAGYGSGTSWPAFEQPAARSSYPASYEVRSGWAVADDTDPLTGPSPASGTPTVPGRAVSAYDDVLSSTPVPPTPQGAPFAYETGDITTAPAAAWPEPPSSATAWPTYGSQNGNGNGGGNHRRGSDQEHPHDYYR
ncbi:hypothetical protein ACIBI9_09085 [Nonomuraea sp. NPDC050451]|uniref:hypothetical protein n=1 Tax=Nonomuraea sp. NPDC050451 TaxID=3364364 RepID=UPI0037B2CF87